MGADGGGGGDAECGGVMGEFSDVSGRFSVEKALARAALRKRLLRVWVFAAQPSARRQGADAEAAGWNSRGCRTKSGMMSLGGRGPDSQKFFAALFFKKATACFALLLIAPAALASQNPSQVSDAIRQAALAIAPPDAAVALGPVDGANFMPACTVPLTVSMSGAAPYEQAAAHCGAPVWTLYVTVTVAQTENIVVAARPVAAGQVIGAGDLMLKPEPVSDYAGRQVYYDPARLLGGQALMSLSAGTILSADNIGEPVVVKAGQTVTVLVTSGAVEVSITAVADQTGRIGDTILLTNPSSGRRFTATVTQAGPVVQLQS